MLPVPRNPSSDCGPNRLPLVKLKGLNVIVQSLISGSSSFQSQCHPRSTSKSDLAYKQCPHTVPGTKVCSHTQRLVPGTGVTHAPISGPNLFIPAVIFCDIHPDDHTLPYLFSFQVPREFRFCSIYVCRYVVIT